MNTTLQLSAARLFKTGFTFKTDDSLYIQQLPFQILKLGLK